MRRFRLMLLCATLMLVSGGYQSVLTQAEAMAFNARALCQSIVRRTNAYRKNKGLKGLKVDRSLTRAAQKYAEFYAANPGHPALWGHQYGGLDPMDRAENAGFGGRCVGENLGWQGTSGALSSLGAVDAKMLEGWINSRTHRKNLEYKGFDVIGVGAARFRADGKQWIVAVQMFGCSQPLRSRSGSMRIR